MKMLFHVGTTASGTSTTATSTTATARRSTATRHTIRGRGTRRTGVARPEWAPQVREVERRRAARTLHLSRDVDAAATAYRSRGQTRRRRRRRRRRANTVWGPNLGASVPREPTGHLNYGNKVNSLVEVVDIGSR